MNDINEILNQRESTHGSFSDNSRTSQLIKEEMKQGRNWRKMDDTMKEALHMIAHKIGRILAGDPALVDHWADISGYSKLVADELTATQSKAACVAQIEMSKTTEPKWAQKNEWSALNINPSWHYRKNQKEEINS